jgi:membrane-bound serine protease (ClpP class)
VVPGVAGIVCLVLAAIAFQILPFDWVGLLLIVVGMGLIVAEAFTPAFGALFASGIICFLVGGSMVFDMPELNDLSVSFWPVLVPISIAFAIVSGIVVFAVGRSNFRAQTAGVAELIGLVGKCTTALDPNGKVFVRGEYWNAQSNEEISAGQAVEVTDVEGMRLRVRRAISDA